MYGQDMAPAAEAFMNVSEKAVWYDTVAVVGNLTSLSKQPPGWYATFAALAGATSVPFFNVRNTGSCEDMYCNLDTRDMTAYAFRASSISCAFWGSVYAMYKTGGTPRWNLPVAIWQAVLPLEASLTLRVQQDDKLKLNCMEACAGYGPVGGGYGNNGLSSAAMTQQYPNMMTQTQGVAEPKGRFEFAKTIDIPRRAALQAELSFTEYGRAALANMPGPGTVQIYNTDFSDTVDVYVMYGITVALYGERLVQQRGALHA